MTNTALFMPHDTTTVTYGKGKTLRAWDEENPKTSHVTFATRRCDDFAFRYVRAFFYFYLTVCNLYLHVSLLSSSSCST